MKTKIKISTYLNNSKLLSCFPEDVFIKMITTNKKYMEINTEILSTTEKEFQHRMDYELVLSKIVELNNRGIQYEKSGMIEKAVLEYERCMDIMYESIEKGIQKTFAWHSPDRLRILYKREKHPMEREFLTKFITFCNNHQIEFPGIYERQLGRE